MAIFELLRLSLSVPPLGELDETRATPADTRQDYIKFLFGERHDFFSKGSQYLFLPAMLDNLPDGAMAGFIGKSFRKLEQTGPDNMFALAPQQKWKAAFVVIDPRPSAQTVAVERRGDLGASHTVLSSFVLSRLKVYRKVAWHVDVEYITRVDEFRAVAAQYRGMITELSFTFNPPNGLRASDVFREFKEFDKQAKQETNSELSEYNLKNGSGGLVAEGGIVDSAAEYASEGAGLIKMKVGNKVVYNSRNFKETIEVSEEKMPRDGEPIKILGATEEILRCQEPHS